jgi:predicted transposase/invertase (TIGR01784 family)
MSKYINPFTDYGFKKLFGEESSKPDLIRFLNSILPDYHQVTSLEYGKNEYQGLNEFDRKAIVDLNCKTSNDETIIIELQKAKQNYFKDRSVYYSTFPIAEQAQKGEWNYQLKAVYMIGILDFTFNEDKHDKTVVHIVQLKDQNNRLFYPKLAFIYLTLPNFTKNEYELETNQDKWLYLFNNLPKLDHMPIVYEQDKNFSQIFEKAQLAKFNERDLKNYQTSLKEYLDMYNVLESAKQEGKTEGEKKAKIEIAKSMKLDGLSIENIIKYSGLTKEQIEIL